MIVKFFNRGKGGGNGPVDYLLGKDRERELARLDQGDPDEIINLINSCKFTQKYKSGCLSFLEEDLPQKAKNEIMADFERALLPGLDKNQYSILWVEHRDKGRLELNFVIPCVELTTGKRLQPYYHKIDQKRVDTWKRIVNTSLNLHDPDAPQNKRAVMDLNVTNLPQNKKLQCNHISQALLNQVEAGLVKNRSDLVISLEEAGFSITRQAKNTVSIKDPNGGKNIKLKGEIYESTFQFSKEHANRVRTEQADYKATKPEELERYKTDFQRLFRATSSRNKKLYSGARSEKEKREKENKIEFQHARGRVEETNRFSDELSDRQDTEIQCCHFLNNGGVHRGDGGAVVLDWEHAEGKYPEDNTTERNFKNRGGKNNYRGWEKLSNSPTEQGGKGFQERQISGLGDRINDRVRKTPIERIGEIIGRSGNNVSRVQKFFRAVGETTAGSTKVLRDFATRKQRYDSVSKALNRSSNEFNKAAKQFIERVEYKREQKESRSYSAFSP